MKTTNENQEEQLTLPRRGLIIKLLFAGLAIFWLAVILGGDLSCSSNSSQKTSRVQQPQNRTVEHRPVKSEIISQSDGSWLIKWTGEGENGFPLPDLAPGGYSLTWIQGKIAYTSAGDSFSLWGTDHSYPEKFQDKFRYRRLGIKNNQVMVMVGRIGSGNEKLFPFASGESRIIFRADGQPIFLFYNYINGLYDQFGWDGSYAVFELKRIE